MSQFGEAVANAVFDTGPCPFCESPPSNSKESLELINDSLELRKYLGNTPPTNIIDRFHDNPPKRYYIKKDYWVDYSKSKVAYNAHHAIPGNASMATCPALLKWMAGKVVFKKTWYEKKTTAKAHLPGTTNRTSISDPDPEVPDIEVEDTMILSSSGVSIKHEVLKIVDEFHVTGKIDYDINKNANGIWLPSNNAIAKWTELTPWFQNEYASKAMEKGFHFHDAHPEYSNKVKKDLLKFDKKLNKKKNDCNSGCETSTPKPRAPIRLRTALEQLSEELKKELKFKKGVPAGAYYTSDRVKKFIL